MGKKESDKNDEPPPLNLNIGVMGHVDSGKTSLVKALSTTLSTASLDRGPAKSSKGHHPRPRLQFLPSTAPRTFGR